MMESYWNVKRHLPPLEVTEMGISHFSYRLGMSLTFDCLRCFKRDIEQGRPYNPMVQAAGVGTAGAGGAPMGPAMGMVAPAASTPSGSTLDALAAAATTTTADTLPDSFLRIDWDAFMEDFDWSFPADYLQTSGPVGKMV